MSKIDEIEKRINAGDNITIEPDGTVRDMTAEEVASREADEARAKEKVSAKTRKPILCLDFDGVIHSYSSGWKGADVIPDPPVEGAIAFMLGAIEHFNVVIFSSRSNQRGGLKAMQNWLREHAGATWYESPAGPGLEDIRFVTEKPAALVTIDDRVITFDGTWPSMETLKGFQPWNKRARAPSPAALDPVTVEACAKAAGGARSQGGRLVAEAIRALLSHPAPTGNAPEPVALEYASTNKIAACRCGLFPSVYGDGAKPDDGYRSLWCQTCMVHVTKMMPNEREVIDHWNELREQEHAALYAAPASNPQEGMTPLQKRMNSGGPFGGEDVAVKPAEVITDAISEISTLRASLVTRPD